MTHSEPNVAAPAADSGSTIARRTILHGAAWSVPAVLLTVGTPAYATSSRISLSLSTPGMSIPAAGPAVLTVTARDAGGAPVSGLSTTVSIPGNSYSGVTDGSGIYAPTVDLDTTWARGGSSVTVTAIAGSASTSAGLTVLGANALGWGAYGAINGVGSAAAVPTQMVRAFPSPIVQARAGGSYNSGVFEVALLSDGTVWTAGANDMGQLGDGTTTNRSTYAKVAGVTDVVQIATADRLVVALRSNGSVWAWGRNDYGQVGDGTTVNRLTPVATSLTGVAQVVAIGQTAFALLNDGTVRAWGRGDFGQLGDGSVRAANTAAPTPVTVQGLTGVTAISAVADGAGMAVMGDGTVRTWGRNRFGILGNGTTTDSATPVVVTGLSGVTKVAGGAQSAYALLSDKTVRSWGLNPNGQLGDGTTTNSTTPVVVSGLSNVSKIGAGWGVFHALLGDGTVKGFGWNGDGLVGDGTKTDRTTAVTVTVPAGVTVTDVGTNAGGGASYLIVSS